MPQSYIKRILDARIYDLAVETPLDSVPLISEKTANQVYLKREDLQPVFSFKIRGAYNRIAHLSDAERAAGIITASAGNHAQGVAFSGQKLAIDTTIVEIRGETVDLAEPWPRVRMVDAVSDKIGRPVHPSQPIDELRALADEHDVRWEERWGGGKLVEELFEADSRGRGHHGGPVVRQQRGGPARDAAIDG